MKNGPTSCAPAPLWTCGMSKSGGQHGHIARKRFGQHFLSDAGVIDDIVRGIDPRPGQALVEIGPGLGAMTDPVVHRCEHLTVVELDRDLAARLRQRPELTVVESDVLRVDFGALADQAMATTGKKLRVIGNLPYNISTPILFHLLPWADKVQDQHFMLQKEVVDRMVASPGKKDFGRLSVMLQWRYDMENILDVPPEAFDPPPRVDSAIVRMVPLATPPAIDRNVLSELVTVAFSQRRKILRHTLGAWINQRGLDVSFDVQRRAEEVPVAEYLRLATAASNTPAPSKANDSGSATGEA
jgi:16S rRNA (adenine1518-N6/adenine1519-N6)-dimethyltransferase